MASVFSKPYKFFPILCIPSPQIRGDRFEEVNWSIISYYYTVESPYPSMKFLIFWKISKSLSKNSDFTPTAKDSTPREKISYICGLRARIECEPISEHSTRRDRVTNIGYRLFGGASPCELKQHFFHFYMCWKYRFHFYFFSLFMLRTKILDSISKMCFNKI